MIGLHDVMMFPYLTKAQLSYPKFYCSIYRDIAGNIWEVVHTGHDQSLQYSLQCIGRSVRAVLNKQRATCLKHISLLSSCRSKASHSTCTHCYTSGSPTESNFGKTHGVYKPHSRIRDCHIHPQIGVINRTRWVAEIRHQAPKQPQNIKNVARTLFVSPHKAYLSTTCVTTSRNYFTYFFTFKSLSHYSVKGLKFWSKFR